MATRDRDMGLKKILNGMRVLKRKSITIGLHEDLGIHPGEHNSEGLTHAQIGAIQEFGATRTFLDGHTMEIPSRPFTRDSFDRNLENIWRDIQRSFEAAKPTGNFIQAMFDVGKRHAEYQRKVMDAWSDPPNSARTIKYKKKNDPLDWTGAMIHAVKAKIE
jgi:hypothetical protein